ncbi:hypothetical protein Golomagni_07487, partial [Golovinomyces magnicellulatus]
MEFDARDVAEHKTADDAYLIIHGSVYDVTKYLADHPGGAEVLIEAAGSDASDAFDNAGHSEDAFEAMEEFKVGKVKGFEKKKPKKVALPPKQQKPQQVATKSKAAKLVNLGLFSAAITGAYFAARQYGPTSVPRWLVHIMNNEQPGKHGYGFTKGLLVGGGIFAVVDYILAQHFAQFITPKKSFTSYPAHMKVPEPVQEDTLTILGLPIGQHVAIKAEIEGEAVSRSYTPVSNNSDLGVLELVIKAYPDGKLTSQYLAKLEAGDEVLFRGPKGAMRYHDGLCKKIGMVAGGTGITPMFQLIRAICENDRDLTEVSLIYANRPEQDILL